MKPLGVSSPGRVGCRRWRLSPAHGSRDGAPKVAETPGLQMALASHPESCEWPGVGFQGSFLASVRLLKLGKRLAK